MDITSTTWELLLTSVTFLYECLKSHHADSIYYSGSPTGFGEQGNIGKILRGTREHEPIFREQGSKTLQLEDENLVSKFIEKGANKENMWEHWNIGQFWKGTRELGPPMGDPHYKVSQKLGPQILKPQTSKTQTPPNLNSFQFLLRYGHAIFIGSIPKTQIPKTQTPKTQIPPNLNSFQFLSPK